jgi:hypothetical protein
LYKNLELSRPRQESYCLPSSIKKPPCSEDLLNCTLYLVVGFWYLMVKKSQRNPLIQIFLLPDLDAVPATNLAAGCKFGWKSGFLDALKQALPTVE